MTGSVLRKLNERFRIQDFTYLVDLLRHQQTQKYQAMLKQHFSKGDIETRQLQLKNQIDK